ncbi:MAG TPA: hypothetical protein VEI58_07680 [Chthoniobacterales bacterium]|nr:hypothetical protein [Chthoniobacterales bacterium]
MKIRGLVVALFAVAFVAAPQLVNTASAQSGYLARLISPTAGQILHPGQTVRVQWKSILPPINLGACEMEVWLSLDGGKTYSMIISPWMDPKAQYFWWTVPNMPTNAAVLDVRFGCEPGYPECYAPQPASTFVIANGPAPGP